MDNHSPYDDVIPRQLPSDIKTKSGKIYDLAIIGAGMTGSNAALGAIAHGLSPKNVCLIDQSQNMWLEQSASRRSAGKFMPTFHRTPDDMAGMLTRNIMAHGETQEAARKTAQQTVTQLMEFLTLGCEIFKKREARFDKAHKSVRQNLLVVDRYLTVDKMKHQLTKLAAYGLTQRREALSAEGATYELGARPGRFSSGYIEPLGGCFHPGHYLTGLHEQLLRGGVSFFIRTQINKIEKENGLFVLRGEDGVTVRAKKLFAASVVNPKISPTVHQYTLPFYAHALAIPVHDNPSILPNVGAFYDTGALALYGQRRDDVLWIGRSDTYRDSRRIRRRLAQRHLQVVRNIFPIEPGRENLHWDGVYYQASNEMPVLAEEAPGFLAAGGLGGYGNTLGQILGDLAGRYLASQALNKLDVKVTQNIRFFLNLPRGKSFAGDREAAAAAIIKKWQKRDERQRVNNHAGKKPAAAPKTPEKPVKKPRAKYRRATPHR